MWSRLGRSLGRRPPATLSLEPSHLDRFEKSPVAQAVCDRHAVLVDVNPAFARLLGERPERFAGRPMRELSHRSDPGAADDALDRLLSGAVEATQVQRILQRTDGRPVPTLASATALVDASGCPTGAVALFQDLTLLHSVEERRRQQEDFFLALAQRASDLAVVLDREGCVLFTSPALVGVLGHAIEDVVAHDAARYVHPDDLDQARTAVNEVLDAGGSANATIRLLDVHGAWHWMELTAANLLNTAVGGVVCNLRDVTDRMRAEAALRASERRYRAIADNADEGLLVTGPDGRVAYTNQRLADILGLDGDEVLGRPLLEVLDPDEHPVIRVLVTGSAGPGAGRQEVAYEHPDGGQRVLRVSTAPLDDAGGTVEGTLAMVADVTDARRLEQELRKAALHDALTGLPNRALLRDRLQHALARETTTTAVLLVDLDRFRLINEAHGHAAGDDLLIAVGTRLSCAVRPADTVARFGGDQFLVVCEDVGEAAATAIGADLLAALRPPFPVSDGEVLLAASIGVALSPAPGAGVLLARAETALRAAKAGGRGQVRTFDAEEAAVAEQRFELGVELARSLAADELRLHYQPVVDLRSGDVVGVEALARWDHGLLGPVSPARFVAVAEAEGLAATLDDWAVERALREAAALRAGDVLAPSAYIAVNMSARSLSDPGLEHRVATAAEAAGIAPQDVVLEVTESATMSDAAVGADVLGRLRQRGFGVAVDDFGTGHSSLAYLRRLPVCSLKVDRSFVAEITTDPHARAITASIVELARTIGLSVIAEGVETPEQAMVLRSLRVDTAQGWLWSPAISPDEARRTGALRRRYPVAGEDAEGSSS